MQVSVLSYHSLSQSPGVYIFLGEKNEVLYVGKAKNLKSRVSSYFSNRSDLGPKTKRLIKDVRKIKTIEAGSEIESLLLEAKLIKKHRPKYNIRLTDGKAYPLIKITVKDRCPRVLIARRQDDKNSIYFGPFPNAGAVRLVLKTVRKIFPYQSVSNHPNKICFYHHLNLCPCPAITNDPNYKKTIKRLILFLNGQTKKVVQDLVKERNELSKKENYEEALEIQKKIDAIQFITNPVYRGFDYQSFELPEDIRKKELSSIEQIIKKEYPKSKKIKRIECFDISNIGGKNAVGSLTVFIKGSPDKSHYRRFRIKTTDGKADDTKSMSEVIGRRFNHPEWNYPELIVVDGGKGQLSATLRVLKERRIDIPVIGLAKKEETIIMPENEIRLKRNNPGLQLIMRIRDEAHRFAIEYHKKLRAKQSFS